MAQERPEIIKNINLESYSSSPGWLGFFEQAGSNEKELDEAALEYFVEFFSAQIPQSIIHLFFSLESLEKARHAYDLNAGEVKHLKWLVEKDWLVPGQSDRHFLQIKASDYSREDIAKLVGTIIKIGDFIGHCFVVLPGPELILYPHEDCGFGVIVPPGKARLVGDMFLDMVAKDTRFRVMKTDENAQKEQV